MIGTAGTPGHIVSVRRLTALNTSGRIGEAGPLLTSPGFDTFTSASANTLINVLRTYSTESSGSTRQFTFAAANWGSAFLACPPSSSVATQVVRSVAFHAGEA